MTNQPPLNPDAIQVAAVASRHALWDEDFYGFSSSSDAQDYGFEEGAKWAQERLAVAQPVVNSVEELNALPVGSVIMMRGLVAPFLHTDDGWESTRTPGKPVWDYTNNPHYLPARVLYRPTEELTNGR